MMISLTSLYNPEVCLGVLISNSSTQALAMNQLNKPHQPLWSKTISSEVPLITNNGDYTALRNNLSELVSSIEAYSNVRIPIQISIADPASIFYCLEFDSLPNNKTECRNFVNWQLSKQYHIDSEKLALTYQHIGKHHDRHVVLAFALDKELINVVMEVFREASLTPTLLNPGVCYLYNAIADTVHSKSVMTINMEDTYWTILIWDECSGLQYVRSKWHDGLDNNLDNYQDLIRDIERTARAFVQHKQGGNIEVIHLCGDDIQTSVLHSYFTDNFKTSCIKHNSEMLFTKCVVDGEFLGSTLLATSLCKNG